jgi:hypothetical protein
MKKTSSTAEAVDPRGIVAELGAHPPTRAEVKNFSASGLLMAPRFIPRASRNKQTWPGWLVVVSASSQT